MRTLLLLSAVLCSCTPLGMAFVLLSSQELPSGTSVPPISSAPTVTMSSCKDQLLQDVKEMLLDALNLEQAPRINIKGMSQITAALRTELSAISQNSDHSAVEKTGPGFLNSTAENDTQRAKTEPHCCQITSQIFITDLGWESWIVYPESFNYTQCEACNHGRSRTWQHCRQGGPSAKHHVPKVKCCSAVEELWLRFVYIDEDSPLVISNVPLTQKCGCPLDRDAE
ncbi:uncharacterized protein LOC117423791 isoform X1 [Acipenser ruthenus]|uniref:uncharacterized protein LOC117423791 isoform X1 n=1 Tax=Acipenser ruthenus TaxID=7906 RepID=UPI00145B0246|nr:uncharacterized protein LOC117423791 isoform X1 [Acipenser ruthenus]